MLPLRSFAPRIVALLLSILSLVGSPLAAGVLDEPHLNIIPRTADEMVRIAAATAPAENFDAPNPFEANPAGAATVRARSNADAAIPRTAPMTTPFRCFCVFPFPASAKPQIYMI